MDYPFNKEEYLESYKELEVEISNLWWEFYIVRDNKTYLWNWEFSNSWKFINDKIVESGKIKVDIVYDKWEFTTDNKVEVFNSEYINKICTDKYKTYELFKEFCPETIQVNNEEEFNNALNKIEWEIKVIKPLDWEEGNWVFIWDENYLKKCEYNFPLLVQEFLDTSEWIPNIYKWIHDLRLVYVNWEIIYSFYRTPPEWELLANVAQWWKLVMVDITKLPKEVLDISKTIENHFSWNYCLGIDLGFVRGKPKIIELNSRVWLQASKRGKEFIKFKKTLAKIFVK